MYTLNAKKWGNAVVTATHIHKCTTHKSTIHTVQCVVSVNLRCENCSKVSGASVLGADHLDLFFTLSAHTGCRADIPLNPR